MPDSIRLEVCKFEGCHVFDIRASGNKIACVETSVMTGIFGSKSVFVFEPHDTADDLSFTIRKAKGDVHIDLPITWTAYTNATSMDEMDTPFPDERHFARVTAEKDGRRFDIGFVDGPNLTINFKKVAKAI